MIQTIRGHLVLLACASLIVFVIFWTMLGKLFHVEGVSYPEATLDLSVIETWEEEEVESFADDLECFSVALNEDFYNRHPEMSKFCKRLRRIWADKYSKKRAEEVSLELFDSIANDLDN